MSASFNVSVRCVLETSRLGTVSDSGGTGSGVKSGIRASNNNGGGGGIVGDVQPGLGVTSGTVAFALGGGNGVLVVLTVSDGVSNIGTASITGELFGFDSTLVVVARETGSSVIGATLAV